MDDLQFRRTLYADPKCQDSDFVAAKNADSNRKKIAHEVDVLESKLESAFQIPVPTSLCDKLILGQTMASHRQQKRRNRVHLALAASVAFAFGLTLNFMQFSSAYAGIDDYALAHVYHERGVFDNNSDTRVSLSSLNTKMAAFNGSFSSTIGELIAADYCRFDGVKSLHLVFQGEKAPINVFVVPKRDDVLFAKTFSDSILQGVASEFGEQNVIIVGDKTESLAKWQSNLSQNIQWSI